MPSFILCQVEERMKKHKKLLLIALELLIVLGIAAGVVFYQRRANERDTALVGAEEAARRFTPSITYQGKSYPLKRNVTSLLLIGTDNYIDDDKQIGDDFPYNFNLADFLVILVFDHSNKTVTPFQICRDAMCDVTVTSGATRQMQITLSHTYGSGKEDSAINTRNAVEGLLYWVPVDYFLTFTMETVPLMNDLVGGVTVKLEDDIPALGSEYVKGAEITLRGNAALRFVRYRDTELLDDNVRRMAHHRLYLTAFTGAARAAVANDPDLATKAFRRVEKYLCTNLSVENVSTMVEDLCEYEILPAVTPPGVYTEGEEFPEYHLDEAALWECVRTVFCS